ncbi:MAG: SEL1-like repeat protein [Rariglobus sp.]
MKSRRLRSAFGLCCVSLLVVAPPAHANDTPPSLATLQAKAEAGDVQALEELGRRYEWGEHGTKADPTKAREWYRKAVAKGSGEAAFQLGSMDRSGGEGREPDLEAAFRWFHKAAELGYPGAHFELGFMYKHGDGTPPNPAESLKSFLKAAELGESTAQYEAGMAFAEGLGTKKDLVSAAKWFARAAPNHDEAAAQLRALLQANPDLRAKLEVQVPEETKQLLAKAAKGDVEAQMLLADHYTNGSGGLLPNDAAAVKWLHAAATAGHAPAQYSLGYRISHGDAAPGETGAADWLKKAAAQKVPEAAYELGLLYRSGIGVPEDPVESLKWFRAAAALGHLDAKSHVALAYQNGWGVASDTPEAIRWFTDAADQGHPQAMFSLAMLALQPGPNQDKALARKWLKRAAEMKYGGAREELAGLDEDDDNAKLLAQIPAAVKNPTRDLFINALRGNADAQFKLGISYEYGGDGLTPSLAEQVKWFKAAAEQGHVFAQRNLGQVLMTGKGVPRDDAEAFKWMRRAAEKKDADAAYYLGVLYRDGRGTAKDPAEAAKWLKASSDAGRHSARLDLAALLLAGDGVAKNETEAVALLTKTANEKNGEAMWRLSQLYARGINGAPPDAAKAQEWIVKAGALGQPDARAQLAALAATADAEKFAAAEREFQTAFAAATTTAARSQAINAYTRVASDVGFAQKLTQPQIAEKVLAVLRPKMEANLVEAGEYTMAIHSLAFDRDTLHRVLPATVIAQIKVYSQKVTDDFYRRENALQPIRALVPKAEAGDRLAQTQIAEGLFAPGPAQDVKGALVWFQRAADAGHAPARQRLGKILYDNALVEEKAGQREVSRQGFEKAAGYGNTNAMLLLAARHLSDAYGKPDQAAAKAWADKAAAAGDPRGKELLKLADAMKGMEAKQTFDTALKAYEAGDFAAALSGWEKGAAAGDAYAMYALGILYERGEGVRQDYLIARSWYEKAQAGGHPEAAKAVQVVIGYTVGLDELAKGEAEAKANNSGKALEWYAKSAELGNTRAMIAAGNLYLTGKGTEAKNSAKAIEWFEKAAAKGDAIGEMLLTSTKQLKTMSDLVATQKEMNEARDRIDGVVRVKTPAATVPEAGVKDLRKNSPWTVDDMLAALKQGADHGALASAIEQDKTAPEFSDFELKRLLNTPEGRRIESLSPLSVTLHQQSRQGAGAWAHELAVAVIEARRKQVGRMPKPVDSPELRAKAAAGDVPALFTLATMPPAERKLGPVDYIPPEELRKKIIEANYAPAFHYVADYYRNNPDKSKNDPLKHAEYVWKSAEAGSPMGMRALGMLFLSSTKNNVSPNYVEAEYWLIEAAARAPEGTMEESYLNPARDVGYLYSFTVPFGGPQSWPMKLPNEATLRWARELSRRGGKLADVAEVSLVAIERELRDSEVREKLAALPPEVPLWPAAEVARLDQAARAGDAAAAFQLGEAAASGRGVRQHDARAVEYYQLAANRGNAKAAHALATHYETGFGVRKSNAQKLAWLEKAGAAGDASAWREVGDMHQFFNEDKSIGQNYPRALAAYDKAIAGGDIPAYHQLGMMHEHGRGVPRDLVKAGELYRKGADGVHAGAQRRFAQMLADQKKFTEAAAMFGKAAAGGAFGARSSQARMLIKSGDTAAALSVYREIFTKELTNYQDHVELGSLLEQTGALAEAADVYRAVIAANSVNNTYRDEAKKRLAAVEAQLASKAPAAKK